MLCPVRCPSLLMIQLTAPTAFAVSASSSIMGMTACLCGSVTQLAKKPSARKDSTLAARSSGCVGQASKVSSMLWCLSAAFWNTGERVCPKGYPMIPKLLVDMVTVWLVLVCG